MDDDGRHVVVQLSCLLCAKDMERLDNKTIAVAKPLLIIIL